MYLKVTVQKETYTYSYSFDQKDWKEIDVIFESSHLSDDFIRGGGFLQGHLSACSARIQVASVFLLISTISVMRKQNK